MCGETVIIGTGTLFCNAKNICRCGSAKKFFRTFAHQNVTGHMPFLIINPKMDDYHADTNV